MKKSAVEVEDQSQRCEEHRKSWEDRGWEHDDDCPMKPGKATDSVGYTRAYAANFAATFGGN
jgi:hypothetical protein